MKPLSPFDCGEGVLICNAAVGYDGPTGVGTPNGIGAFKASGEPSGGGSPESKSGPGTGGSTGAATPGETATSTGSPGSTAGSTNTGSAQTGSTNTSSHTPTSPPVRLSHLTLTASASAAIRRGRPRLSQLALAFTLSAPSQLRLTLTRGVRIRGHLRWMPAPGSLTASEGAGRDRLRLHGRRQLPPGLYRVTLTPTQGPTRTLTFVLAATP